MHTLSTISNYQLKEIIQNNFDVTKTFLNLIYSKLKQEKSFSFGNKYELSTVQINEDGDVIATYSRYLGSGETSCETEYVNLDNLFKNE
jgi:hypothetical protein